LSPQNNVRKFPDGNNKKQKSEELTAVSLTKEEKEALASLKQKTKQIRAYVRGVCQGLQTGLILNGEGGTGKSFNVLDELRLCKAKVVHHQNRVTARGLFDELENHPNKIHLIEDCESLFRNRDFTGLMRGALHSQDHSRYPERNVTWLTYEGKREISFTGGVIIVSNVSLPRAHPDFRALRTRCPVMEFRVTNAEMTAQMKEIAFEGYDVLSAKECLEVLNFIVENMSNLNRPLDLRLLVSGFRFAIQEKEKQTRGVPWRTLLQGQIQESIAPDFYRTSDRVAEESLIALEIDQMKISYQEKLTLFQARTHRAASLNTIKVAFSRAVKRASG